MRCLVQRVRQARVDIAGEVAGEIGTGVMAFVCAMEGDTDGNAEKLARKMMALRIFADEAGRMNRSLLDVGGAALIISQFTLAADTARGNRPGFSSAADPAEGERLYDFFCACVRGEGVPVATGRFGADMDVHLTNDGPVTIWLEA